jgi:ATP-dependent protease ClpP protease subunit
MPQEQNKKQREDTENTRKENEKLKDEKISEYGQTILENNPKHYKIHLLSIVGEIEGHENLPSGSKTTKYDHVLPQLAQIEDDKKIEGLLVLLNTSGGDVDAGLAIAEMISSLSIPTVSLVLGGSHSIGGPLAVSTDYSFIVPSGAMIIHPVRMSGMVIGAPQTYDYFKRTQDRITGFIASHSHISQKRLEEMMINTAELTKDLGTILIGEDAVREGLIDEVGGIRDALNRLYQMVDKKRGKQAKKEEIS